MMRTIDIFVAISLITLGRAMPTLQTSTYRRLTDAQFDI